MGDVIIQNLERSWWEEEPGAYKIKRDYFVYSVFGGVILHGVNANVGASGAVSTSLSSSSSLPPSRPPALHHSLLLLLSCRMITLAIL